MNNLLSVRQVAFMLKVHPLTIRRYIKEKKLKAVKVGGNVRISENDLQDFQKDASSVTANPADIILRAKKYVPKEFSDDDPFLRLKGRGANLNLS